MAFAASLTFTTKNGNANDGMFTLTATYSGLSNTRTVKVGYSIQDPTGTTIKEMPDFPTANDFTFVGGATGTQTTVEIPKGSDGSYLEGDYYVRIYYNDAPTGGGLATVPELITRTYYWTPRVTEASANGSDVELAGTASCVTGLIKATDSTDYTGRVISSRSLTLKPPVVTGQPTPADTTGSDTSGDPFTLQTTTLFDNVVWMAVLDVNWSLTSSGTITMIEVVRTINSVSIPVSCQEDYCALATCMEADFKDLEAKTCGSGGFAALSNSELANLAYKNSLFAVGYMKQKCGDMLAAKTYFDKLKSVSGDCGCGCAEAVTDPVAFVGWE